MKKLKGFIEKYSINPLIFTKNHFMINKTQKMCGIIELEVN